MNGLIRASLGNPYAVTVMSLTLIVLGALSITLIPIDILPVFRSPAVQTLTFYNGMSANSIAHDITNRMERWTGQANGMARQESRSILGASIVRNYFQGDVDPNGALTQVNSLALAAIPNLPPGTLPPVVLPYDPTSTTPVCVVALDSADPANDESVLYDVGRYEVRNMIMGQPGAVAPVVYGGKIRAVLAYIDRQKMQARNLSPQDVLSALNAGNVFLPTGDAKFGDLDYVIDSNSMYENVADMGDIPVRIEQQNATYLKDVATPKDANYIQTNVVRVNGKREVYIPVFRQLGASTLRVVENLRSSLTDMEGRLTRSGINLKLVMDQSVYVQKVDRGAGAGGVAGGGAVLARHLDVPGRVADDGHRDHDLADLLPVLLCRALLHGSNHQHDDSGRDDAGDRTDDRQRHHLPREYAPPSGHGRDAAGGGVPGGQRGRHARARLHALHVPGALTPGLDARTGPVSLQADGHGGRLFDDRGLFPVANAGAGLLGVLAQAARRSRWRRPRPRSRRARSGGRSPGCEKVSGTEVRGTGDVSDQWQRPAATGEHDQSGIPSLGRDDRHRHRILHQGS